MPHSELEKIEIAVMSHIKHTRIVRARFYIGLHTGSILAAVGLLIPAAQSFTTAATQSGFTTYLSLISSDGAYILSSWKDFGLSIVESVPIFETFFILALALIIGNALRQGTRYIPTLTSRRNLAVIS